MSRSHHATWGAGNQAEQHYLVEPRHLAGGGDIRHVTEFLRASGWTDRSVTGGPLVFDRSDHLVRVVYDPAGVPGGWHIQGQPTATESAWQVNFTRQTPVEIVAGFTDALTRERSAHAPNPWAPLQQQHWETERNQHFTAISPDRNTWLQFHQNSPGQAHWWAGARTEHGRTWDAVFSATTPMHLIETFSAALADPQPVMRPRGHVPPSKWIQVTSVSVRPSELSAWQQARITAARAATWGRNSWGATRARTRKQAATARPYASAGGAGPRR
ncbi:SPDY domain-containing protein [Streptomyces microflavus]|uniref:DUF317 domain-containing protein n=1 Tax=Streptomyces microflavus TaxID=1919 RepID=UPI002E35F31A|nr:DUF317 domain-containing protein [Streptomyces microflavus]